MHRIVGKGDAKVKMAMDLKSEDEGGRVERSQFLEWWFKRRLRKILNLNEFEGIAKKILPRPIFGYVAGAAETNFSYKDNYKAFREYGFIPNVCVDVTERNAKVCTLGKEFSAPFGIAPMGVCALTAYRGDIALASEAKEAVIPMVISAASLITMEDIARAYPDVWYQTYLPNHRDDVEGLLTRVQQCGINTLVVTVDSSVVPSRENNVRNGYQTPLRPSIKLLWDGLTHLEWSFLTFLNTFRTHGMPYFENVGANRGEPLLSKHVERDFSGREKLCWEDLAYVRDNWQGNLVIKGILSVADAQKAADMGADGIILSNHGGRQLDGDVSPLRILPSVVDQVGGQVSVMIDSGFRRGSDVLKAIGLGADFVFIGRPFHYAAAVGGRAGVEHAIQILKTEIDRNMGMLGVNKLEELTRDNLMRIR
ncbi:alpha-hydroxy acid oxidase [Salinicola halophyticus]|uniref:alpha-hydroxy acid oxidase n=1 Tax=Salinicola halophyticus TaxID=1808881 RepID=UPI003F47A7FF